MFTYNSHRKAARIFAAGLAALAVGGLTFSTQVHSASANPRGCTIVAGTSIKSGSNAGTTYAQRFNCPANMSDRAKLYADVNSGDPTSDRIGVVNRRSDGTVNVICRK